MHVCEGKWRSWWSELKLSDGRKQQMVQLRTNKCCKCEQRIKIHKDKLRGWSKLNKEILRS